MWMCVEGPCVCTGRCCVGVYKPEGFVLWGTPQFPAPTAKPEVSLAPPACAGCSWVLCRRGRAPVHGEQGQRAQPKRGFAFYLCISLLCCRSQASPRGPVPSCLPATPHPAGFSLLLLPFPWRCSLRSGSNPTEGNTPPRPRCVYPKQNAAGWFTLAGLQ